LTDPSVNIDAIGTPADDAKELLNQTQPLLENVSPFRSNKNIAADVDTLMTLKKDMSRTSHVTVQHKGEQSLHNEYSKRSNLVSLDNLHRDQQQQELYDESHKVAQNSVAQRSGRHSRSRVEAQSGTFPAPSTTKSPGIFTSSQTPSGQTPTQPQPAPDGSIAHS